MAFRDYQSLAKFMHDQLGVGKALYKELVDNDNSKQQIYLGGGFAALSELPFGEITKCSTPNSRNFRAKVDLWWINEHGEIAPAKRANLVLYTKYPEVRLSGFLVGCKTAPSGLMNPKSAQDRGDKNTKDGRVLILGVAESGRIYAYLAQKSSSVARSIPAGGFQLGQAGGTLLRFPLSDEPTNSRELLIARLSKIIRIGWIESVG